MISLRQRMSSVDAAWLRMERRTNPMVIVAVIILRDRLPLLELRRTLRERFLCHERFRRVAVEETVGGAWIDDPLFDLDAHCGEVRLPSHATRTDLESLAGELASTPLDPRRPLWRFDLVPEYAGGSAVVMRIHHCYADGIALVRMFLGLTTDGGAAGEAPEAGPAQPPMHDDPHADDDALARWLHALAGNASELVGDALSGGQGLLEFGIRSLLHPLDSLGDAQKIAGTAGGIGAEIATLLRLPDDPDTPLRGALGARKQVAWGSTLPLADVRTVAHALGCTINDVVMSVVAGTLGRYVRAAQRAAESGAEPSRPAQSIRAAVPVNLRASDEPPALGNRFGLVFVDLPLALDSPVERLRTVRASMQALKGSMQPAAAYAMLNALGYLPGPIHGLAVDALSRKATAVVSNVPGPREPRRLGGRIIDQMYFWVPQSGSIGLGISILTYANQVLFGVIADRNVIPDPHRIVDGFAEEFERLLLLTVMAAAGARAPAKRGPTGATAAERRVASASAAGSRSQPAAKERSAATRRSRSPAKRSRPARD